MGLVRQLTDDRAVRRSAIDVDDVVSSNSWLESHPAGMVRIGALVFEDSPRLSGEDPDHVRLLAEAGDTLPPIIVHRPTMRVIDGIHRVRAALLNGTDEISARLLDCDENTAFVLAVKANITHGLPLSQSDRTAAATRIIAHHPQWSDRAVAAATGLSDKTISKVRSTAGASQSNTRVGRDGRVRPLDSGTRRQQAAAMINDKPETALRAVARATGLSVATVRDVRQRIDRGEDPVPGRYRHATSNESATVSTLPRRAEPASDADQSDLARDWKKEVSVNRNTLLAKLRHDPSLKHNETGRHTLRWLHHHTVDPEGLENLTCSLPDHCAPVVADFARNCAAAWTRVAEELEQRTE